ncbi:general transcription factor IIH subunit 2 [Planococcus citri]|uniref:general transcription factor IIH subunit 2 n=1 Tax=Planococcus citri TaxID=170843 RepID=UPI0031F7E583
MTVEMNDIKEYRWETGYEKSWEEIKENERGLGLSVLSESLSLLEQKKKKVVVEKVVRLGMMRHLNIIIDFSDSMLDQDLKPTRQICTLKLVNKFIQEFLEQNPISQLGIVATRNKRAEKISDLSGNAKKHLQSLEPCNSHTYCVGESSLQNALELALGSMKMLPSHTSREILVIFGSLTTCDPGNVIDTIKTLKNNGIKCSVIGLCAEVYVLRHLCNETSGQYHIVLDDTHFQELLMGHVKPRSVNKDCEATCVKMGFPHHLERLPAITYCLCHLNETKIPNKTGYFCPQCNSKYCELPVECKTCGITLVTSAHLVRPLHHLIPIHPFREIENSPNTNAQCYGCMTKLQQSTEQISVCNECKNMFCPDCDNFIHNSLHVCPGCAVASK